ncbi:HAD family hydrolase [Mariniflexile soesokkakense]|uniref:HAD family hydrolase n=1 Tax=Mariniflexile soesokkakense TaxID=1343160 RepID=A0ABV0AF11_9FLAO
MITKSKFIIVFDLDDTLYNEIDFLKSAYKEISSFLSNRINISSKLILSQMLDWYNDGLNVFDNIIKTYRLENLTVHDLIYVYRNHKPEIVLTYSSRKLLDNIKSKTYKQGLITDGRSIQQRNKISALGLSEYFDDLIISEEFGSEKPCMNNYQHFIEKYGDSYDYVYIADNISKDFISPNILGWTTICLLDNGKNIHKQVFDLDKEYKPTYLIKDLIEVNKVLNI